MKAITKSVKRACGISLSLQELLEWVPELGTDGPDGYYELCMCECDTEVKLGTKKLDPTKIIITAKEQN